MDLLRNPFMPDDYKGNGCGSGWKEPLVPDSLGGIDISEACGIHDYDYEVGGNATDFEIANMHFLFNMLIIINRDDTWYTNEDTATKWAVRYYQAVVKYGKEYFNWRT